MIQQQRMETGEGKTGKIHNCSNCPNFNIFNQGMCFSSCRMGQERVPHWELILPQESSGFKS